MFGIRDLPADWFTRSISYNAAHDRVRRARGRADLHPCADCGHRAQAWSYDGGSEFEQSGFVAFSWGAGSTLRWTTDADYYSARCRRCHIIHDRGHTSMPDPGPADPIDVNMLLFHEAIQRGDKQRAKEAMNRLCFAIKTEEVSA